MRKLFLILAFALSCLAGGGDTSTQIGGAPPTCDPNCQWWGR